MENVSYSLQTSKPLIMNNLVLPQIKSKPKLW